MLTRLTEEQVVQFRNDGFLAFDTGIGKDAVEDLRAILTRLHKTNTGFKEGALFDALGVDDGKTPRRFPQILHPQAFAPELLDNPFFRTASAIADQLLGSAARFKIDISLMKPARIGALTPWHQDEAFQDPNFEYNEVSFWLALQPTDQTNSCMAYIPGSHKGPVLLHGFPDGDSRIHALECVGFDINSAVLCPVPAGGCVIHNARTVHGAGPNLSDKHRLAYVLIFDLVPVPAATPRSFPWRSQHHTARAQRELEWRRRGGLLVHLWRQRSRLRLTSGRTLLFDVIRALKAVRRLA